MLKVGTDCSGIEAPIQALKKLGIPFIHEFSCDNDKYVRKSIEANYSPNHYYEDITTRDNTTTPYVDLYVAGFPCQPFSACGARRGIEDARGTIFYNCLDYIQTQRPKHFILENVIGILSIQGGELFNNILTLLREIEGYNVEYVKLNTKDYGIPQNRRRVFIVGSREKTIDLKLLEKYKNPVFNIQDYIDRTDTQTHNIPSSFIKYNTFEILPTGSVFITTNYMRHKNSKGEIKYKTFPTSHQYSPCLTAHAELWCVPMKRYVNVKECLRLQGFPDDFKQVVSDAQMKKQLGNSISVSVLQPIIQLLLS
jgi:DNA (cytosine-5)-methyltransferase 1